jgi:hypothetical protein
MSDIGEDDYGHPLYPHPNEPECPGCGSETHTYRNCPFRDDPDA